MEKDTKITFNPNFTYQIFNDDELIRGYKNLRILISLTPVNLRPHIKILYDDTLKIKDDINKLFKEFYGENFSTNENNFKEILNEEINYEIAPMGKKIHEIKEYEGKDFEVYYSQIKNDERKNLSLYLQLILPYFIEGANVIEIEENFWHYFFLYEKIENKKWNIIGFCTINHFHMDLFKYRSMISQFFILNPYQRMGFGLKLLEVILFLIFLFLFRVYIMNIIQIKIALKL